MKLKGMKLDQSASSFSIPISCPVKMNGDKVPGKPQVKKSLLVAEYDPPNAHQSTPALSQNSGAAFKGAVQFIQIQSG